MIEGFKFISQALGIFCLTAEFLMFTMVINPWQIIQFFKKIVFLSASEIEPPQSSNSSTTFSHSSRSQITVASDFDLGGLCTDVCNAFRLASDLGLRVPQCVAKPQAHSIA